MSISPDQKYKPAFIFLVLVFALSSVFYALIIHTGKLGSGFGMYVTGLMWCPGIAALLTCKICGRSISSLGWNWNKTKYQLQSWVVPALYGLIAYLIIWVTGWGKFYNHEFVNQITESFGWKQLPAGFVILFYTLMSGVFGMIGSVATGLGEEIGWRGFLVPELYKKFNYTTTSLLTGIIWSLWHYPILLFADYNSGTPAWYGLTCFTIMVISISFIFTWYRMKSGSLCTGAILHGSHNLFIQSIFTPLTKDTGHSNYYIDEFGAVLPVVGIAFAVYFWSRRKELKIQT